MQTLQLTGDREGHAYKGDTATAEGYQGESRAATRELKNKVLGDLRKKRVLEVLLN